MKKSVIALAIASSLAMPVANADIVFKLGGGLKAEDKEKSVEFQTGGRLQWDYNNATYDDGITEEVTDESDFHVRRARVFVKAGVDDWEAKLQYNIAEDGADGGTPEDLYIRYKGFGKKAVLTVGRQKEALGLEELTSSKDITFLERNAVTEAYAAGRSSGIQVSGDTSWGHYDFGVFEAGSGNKEASTLATTARVVFNPIKTDDSVLHLGVAVSDRANDVERTGIEVAYSTGSLHIQAERMEQDNDGTSFDASYVQLGYILTGESRPYKGGKFKRVKPDSKSGAWEVVARVANGEANFSDTELGNADAQEIGVGVNLYLNNNVRLGATYSVSENNDTDEEGSEFRFRTQFVF